MGTGTSRSSKDDNLRDQVAGLKYDLSTFYGLPLRSFVRHIVQELQKENSAHVSKIKSLENENKLIHSETEELRGVRDPNILQRRYQPSKKAVKSLESTLEESISREEQALQREEAPIDPANADITGLQRALRESQVKHEVGSAGYCGIKPGLNDVQGELEKLRKRMSESEQKSNKTILEVQWQTIEIVVTYFHIAQQGGQ